MAPRETQDTLPEHARTRLTRQRIAEAALRIIEQHGVSALSMRALGAALDVQGMAIYRHVRDKDDLLDAVAERLLGELDLSAARNPRSGWQTVIRRVVDAWVRLAVAHPHAFPLIYRDRVPTPADLEPAELILRALARAGFSARSAAGAYRTVVSFVDGVLLGRGISGFAPDTDLWHRVPREATAPLPAVHAALPALVALTTDDVISRGLETLLAGIAAQHRPRPDRTPRARRAR